MSEDKVKVGDQVSSWEIGEDKYNGCEFKKSKTSGIFEITKIPKPEVPDEPMTRGAVVTIEGDDEFIAVRLTGAGDFPYPFIASYSDTGPQLIFSWKDIMFRAAGSKIIVHKMVDPNEVPDVVNTYAEWCRLPEDELNKYTWLDKVGDLWVIRDQIGKFEIDGVAYGLDVLEAEYFPLIRDEKIG